MPYAGRCVMHKVRLVVHSAGDQGGGQEREVVEGTVPCVGDQLLVARRPFAFALGSDGSGRQQRGHYSPDCQQIRYEPQ